jgi:hypothetical protein
MVLLKRGKNNGKAIYVPMDNILKVMAAKIEQVKPAFLFWPSLGTYRYVDWYECDI